MKKIALISIFALILLSTNVFAGEIWQYNTDVEINENINYDIDIILVNYTDTMFKLTIPGSPYDVSLDSTTPCTKESGTLGVDIVCNVWTQDRVDIKFEYSTDNKIDNRDGYFIFSDLSMIFCYRNITTL